MHAFPKVGLMEPHVGYLWPSSLLNNRDHMPKASIKNDRLLLNVTHDAQHAIVKGLDHLQFILALSHFTRDAL